MKTNLDTPDILLPEQFLQSVEQLILRHTRILLVILFALDLLLQPAAST